ncbi:glycerol kinase GlpK [Hyphomicrobium sp. CS1GBMeth3]|uniref:glycerol kinase GlpK n=1 Tax=Hyphomicrobium sp. CS1GBMeth3 TaxID=1892845 RepID=UPI0009308D7D|nr:glycerol kinase GlpK [Hyphomicrobium sp. CS1GBMeth3]
MTSYVLAIDQGTTSSRAIVFCANMTIVAIAQEELPQHYPAPGWVEHDAEDIWRTVLSTARSALAGAGLTAREIAGIGITNQRETILIWERATGQPIHRAIVWQDRRTADVCQQLKDDGHEPRISAATGLLVDPYFSGTKIGWLLDRVPGAREQADRGELAFGTIDSFLLWRLTGGRVHASDVTNAARTLLFNIHRNEWDAGLCELLNVPMSLLPEVRDCAASFGHTAPEHLGGDIPILGMAGDQQAALIGQGCFQPGMMKSTYGTGCFAVLNTGHKAIASKNRLLTTIGYRLDGVTTYALEGSIFIAGAAVQWLRDELHLLQSAAEAGSMAAQADPEQDVILVPAFVGLGAPYWDAEARGAIFGLTRGAGPNELARAALEAVCFQTADLVDAMHRDWGTVGETVMRVDGGMVASDWTMQRLADLLGAAVDRPTVLETTALGAAYLAGLQAGLYAEPDRVAETWALDRPFAPSMAVEERRSRIARWRDAVSRTLSREPAL